MMSTSRKPAVVMRPVAAPLRSRTALVATVVACSTVSIALPATPVFSSSSSSPAITASPGSRNVVGTLRVCIVPLALSCRTKSVKVPPISKASRIMPASAREFAVRRVERAPDARHHVIDLGFRDDERRSEREPIADDAQHQAVLAANAVGHLAGVARRREGGPRAFVLDQLNAGDHADTLHLTNQRMVGEALQAFQHAPAKSARSRVDVQLFVDLEDFQGDGG